MANATLRVWIDVYLSKDIWLQQDGVASHFANYTIDLLGQKLPGTAMLAGHQDHSNWHRWTIFFESCEKPGLQE